MERETLTHAESVVLAREDQIARRTFRATVIRSELNVIGTTSGERLASAAISNPAGPRSPTITIGLSPRYFRTNSCSFPPSLDTTAL